MISPTYLFVFIALCAFAANTVLGDCYMQNPRGSNDRLNEPNADRTNAQRLFDSENNARGGYCWGPELSYYEGSILSVEWTTQHSCGSDNTKCNLVLQYMCSDDSDGADETLMIRDGQTTDTIGTSTNPTDAKYFNKKEAKDGGSVFTYGMNEPFSYYQSCLDRGRNEGLFIGTEQVSGNKGAMATRQNANGQQHGFECSEERDYYPYWHPSPWKDIAVLVDHKDDCKWYQSQSQNVLSKNYCNGTTAAQKKANNQNACIIAGGKWETVAPWGNGKPDCHEAPYTRDNHLGNGVTGHNNAYNWTLPRTRDEACISEGRCACVLRLRYNITVAEVPYETDRLNNSQNSPVSDNPIVSVSGKNFTLALDTAQTGRVFQDRSFMFRIKPRGDDVPKGAKIYNLNVRGKRGNIVQTYPATEYDFVPTFLEVEEDDWIHFQWTGCDTNPENNAGEGKQRTDRSNIVQIASMSHNYPMKDEEITKSNALFKDPKVRLRMAHLDQENCLDYATLKVNNNNNNNNIKNDPQNCYVLNAAEKYFDGGVIKMSSVGTYFYMSTRNNNFSNRSQKGSITVKEKKFAAWKIATIVVVGSAAVVVGAAAGTFVYAKQNPHSRVAEFVQKVPGLGRV